MRKSLSLALSLIGLSVSAPAYAAYLIDIQQVGSDVVASGSGSLNLAAFSLWNSNGGFTPAQLNPNQYLVLGGSTHDAYNSGSIVGPSSFGSNTFHLADSYSGSVLAFFVVGAFRVPAGYVFGSDLGTSTATYNNHTLASLGLATGTYLWTWGQGATADSLTIQVNSAVPEPATWAMMLLGFGLIGGAMRYRRRQQPKVNFAF